MIPSMREFRLRDDLERVAVEGYALPLGVERLEAPAPRQGYVVDFVSGEDDAPDTYAFQLAISHERLRPLLHALFELLPGEVSPVVEIGSVDAYRSIDTYLAAEPLFIDDFLATWDEFEPILLEEVSIGVGATADEPFLEVFVDAWKSVAIQCQVDMREAVDAILEAHGLQEVAETWDEQAFDGVDPARWSEIDLTEIYQETRRSCFETCPRVEIPARFGESYLVHRLALHGVSPWRAPPDDPPRIIAYLRPDPFPGATPEWWLARA